VYKYKMYCFVNNKKSTECKPAICWLRYIIVANSNNNCSPQNMLFGQSSHTFLTDYAAGRQLNYKCLRQECINPWCQVAWVTNFCMVSPNICESLILNLLSGPGLAPKVLRWLLGCGKIYGLLLFYTLLC
jgi:hypothetical protein